MNYGLVSNSAVIMVMNTYNIIKTPAMAKTPGTEERCPVQAYAAGECGGVIALADSIKNEFAGVRPNTGIACFTLPVH